MMGPPTVYEQSSMWQDIFTFSLLQYILGTNIQLGKKKKKQQKEKEILITISRYDGPNW